MGLSATGGQLARIRPAHIPAMPLGLQRWRVLFYWAKNLTSVASYLPDERAHADIAGHGSLRATHNNSHSAGRVAVAAGTAGPGSLSYGASLHAMNEQTDHLDQTEEDILIYTVSDEALEIFAAWRRGSKR